MNGTSGVSGLTGGNCTQEEHERYQREFAERTNVANPYDSYDAGDFDEIPFGGSGMPRGVRYHTREYATQDSMPRIDSHRDLDEALEYIAEGLVEFYRYIIEPCGETNCDVCIERYADEQG